jgi:hypothetical protein
MGCGLAYFYGSVRKEGVGGDVEISGSGSFTNASGGVVV